MIWPTRTTLPSLPPGREVYEDALPLAQRSHPDQGAEGLDVAPALADQAAHVLVGHFDLDRERSPAAVHGVDLDLLRLVGHRPRDELDQRPVVHGGTCGRTVPSEATAVLEA